MTEKTGMTEKTAILWKAAKCLRLAMNSPKAMQLFEDEALEMMDWPDELIEKMLSDAGMVVPVPAGAPGGLTVTSLSVANAFANALEEKEAPGAVFETALVFDKNGITLRWHEPAGRSSGFLPDSRTLWEFLLENKDVIGGVAHTHPWNGSAWPSQTDVTTFSALERGLGVKLIWPVVTFSEVQYFRWVGPDLYDYGLSADDITVDVDGLREKSRR